MCWPLWFDSLFSSAQAWPFIDKAVEGVLRDNLSWLFESPPVNLRLFGLRCVTCDTLTLGGLPAKLGGVKCWRTDSDEVVVDVEVKLAGGDPNIVLTAHTLAGGSFPLQLSELQFFSIVRLSFSNLIPAFPCFGAISVSLVGQPFLDFSLKVVAGDLMAAPGLDLAVSRLFRELIQLIVWPQRVVVPIFDGGDPNNSLLVPPRPTGVLLAYVVRARGLPAGDLTFGAIQPVVRLHVSGQRDWVDTGKRGGRSQTPSFETVFPLMVTDIRLQQLEVDVFDGNTSSPDALVGSACLSLKDRLKDGAAGWKGWVPLQDRRSGMKHAVARTFTGEAPAAVLNVVSLGLFTQDNSGSGDGSTTGPQQAPAGEVFLEIVSLPFLPFEDTYPAPHMTRGALEAARATSEAAVARAFALVPSHWPALPPPGCLVLRLLRATELCAPAGTGVWDRPHGGPPNPLVHVTIGGRSRSSGVARNTSNPTWDEVFEFAGLDVDSAPSLSLTVVSAPPDGVTHTVSRVTKRVTGELTGGLAVVGGAIASAVTGGDGGRDYNQPGSGPPNTSAAAAAAQQQQQQQQAAEAAQGFMGRRTLSTADIAVRSALARGPITEVVALEGVRSGTLFIQVEWRDCMTVKFPEVSANALRARAFAAAERTGGREPSGRLSGFASQPPLPPLRGDPIRVPGRHGSSASVAGSGGSGAATPSSPSGGGGDSTPVAAVDAMAKDLGAGVRWERAVALMRYGEVDDAPAPQASAGDGSGPTTPVLCSDGNPPGEELREAVGIIAELTVALHHSEQSRKTLATAHAQERGRRVALEGAATAAGVGVLPSYLGPRAAALRLSQAVVDSSSSLLGSAGQVLDLGVSSVSTAATSVRSGLETVTSGVASVASHGVTVVGDTLGSAGATLSGVFTGGAGGGGVGRPGVPVPAGPPGETQTPGPV